MRQGRARQAAGPWKGGNSTQQSMKNRQSDHLEMDQEKKKARGREKDTQRERNLLQDMKLHWGGELQDGMKENKWKIRQSDENLQGPAIKGEKEKRGTLLLPSPAAAAKTWVFPLCIRSAWGRCKPFAGSLEFPHTEITLSIPHYW